MNKSLTVFRTSTTAERLPVSGWDLRTVVLGMQTPIPEAVHDLVARLVDRDCVIATSPRAAQWLIDVDLDPALRLPLFVAGTTTGSRPLNAGWDVRIASTPGGESATRLLHSQGFRKPLFVGARETAGTVEEAAAQLGLDLSHLAVYATVPRRDLPASGLPRLEETDFVAFLAPSAVRFLKELAPSYFAALASKSTAAVAGSATFHALRRTGWRHIRLASAPDLVSLTLSLGDPMPSKDLFARAQAVIPGGVHSPVRAFRNVGSEPFYVESARGAHLKTVDGIDLLDWVGSWGPMILGHGNPAVAEAVIRALGSGSSFGACSVPEVELSEEICKRNPWVEKVRLVSSGTEATMSALRLARGFTGKTAFVKFRGCYHGHADSFLVAAGSGALTHGHPSSPGVTPDTAKDTLIAEFNDLYSVEAAFAIRKNDVACVFVEPVPGNMGLIPPAPGFLEGLRRLCDENGALLVLDEVMTGFRLGPAGAAGLFDLRPDLATYGKIIGGGLPLAAFGGRRDIMDRLSPLGPVYQAGTLSGNPLACAAGLALLRELTPAVYQRLEALGVRLEAAVTAGIAGRPLRFQRVGSMATLFFHDGPVTTFADVEACDKEAFGRFFRRMLDKGHFLPPAQFEAFFVSDAHTAADIDRLARDMVVEAIASLG